MRWSRLAPGFSLAAIVAMVSFWASARLWTALGTAPAIVRAPLAFGLGGTLLAGVLGAGILVPLLIVPLYLTLGSERPRLPHLVVDPQELSDQPYLVRHR